MGQIGTDITFDELKKLYLDALGLLDTATTRAETAEGTVKLLAETIEGRDRCIEKRAEESRSRDIEQGKLDRLRNEEEESLESEITELRARFSVPIVCICGSTKFKQSWITENARLTGEGNIVLAVGLWGHHERVFPDAETKERLDDLHKRKIDLCDWVWVLDVGGYIGESTRSEIEYAEKLGKQVRYLSKEFPDYKEK